MKTIAIYHKDCTDGTTAAAVVLKKYPDALTFPLSHGFKEEDLAEIFETAQPSKGDRILTVDCALGVKEFLAKGFSVTTIDHHASARDEYNALAQSNPTFTFVFDNDHSGASLTWLTLFPKEPMPELIKLVEDQDLWRKKYGEATQNVGNFLYMITNQPAETLKLFDVPLDSIKRDGAIISKYSSIMIDNATKKTEPVLISIGQYSVPFYNITVYKSDCGNILSTEKDQTVGLFTIDGDKVKISLRSLEHHTPSASQIAELLGGGGHRNAAGAAMSLADFIKSLV